MLQTSIVYLIAGIALVLSARWIYRTASGKEDECGCGCDAGSWSAPESRESLTQSKWLDLKDWSGIYSLLLFSQIQSTDQPGR
jgi:hypothetical protein